MSVKFLSDIEVQAGLKDSSGAAGTSGQVLSSNGTTVSWINSGGGFANDVQNTVKAGVAITKGQAVYVTGADGTNIIVGLASNTSEATSSKTLGLLNATVAINGTADVVQIGRLSGLNTIGATAGDPVWLGTNGNLIYGLINKPYAPAHLVFIGIVTRVNANNGEIFVNVQNGFELKEIHDVDIITNVPINGDILGYDGTLWVNKTIAEWLGYTPANANGTTNYVSKFTGANTLGNSQIFDNGTNVYINASSGLYSAFGYAFGVKAASGNQSYLSIATPSQTLDSEGLVIGVNADDASIILRDNKPLNFWTNNTERMRITSSGNVGIGTTSPANLLEVYSIAGVSDLTALRLTNGTGAVGANVEIFLSAAGNNGGVRLRGEAPGSNHNNFGVYVTNAGTLQNTPAIFAQGSTNNVGIGTTSPQTLLQLGEGSLINATTNQYLRVNAGGYNALSYAHLDLFNFGNNFGNSLGWRLTSGTEGAGVSVGRYLSFNTVVTDGGGNPSGSTERMRITSTGNVGIGTTAPQAKLHINNGTNRNLWFRDNGSGTGTELLSINDAQSSRQSLAFSASSFYFDNGNVGIGTTSPGGLGEKLTVIGSINSNNTALFFGDGVDNSASIYSTAGPIKFLANASERMRITSSGQVQISSPISDALKLTNTNSGAYNGIIVQNDASNQVVLGMGGSTVGGTNQNRGYSGTVSNIDYYLMTNNSPRLLITSSGNVGIGTTSPIDYQVYGYGANVENRGGRGGGFVSTDSGATNRMVFSVDGSASVGQVKTVTNTPLTFGVNDTERVRITSSGNVGIGTTSPLGKLTVKGGATYFEVNTDITDTSLLSFNRDLGSYRDFNFRARDFIFSPSDVEKVRITNAGNVGIGTTSPSEKLDINGSARIRGNGFLYFDTTGDTSSNYIGVTNDYWTTIYCGRGNASRIDLTNGTGILFSESGAERMRITSGGNVGIGTTTPSAPLAIGRVNSASEGGQIDLCRATDNASSWGIDVYGSTSTPALRFVDNVASSTRMVIDGSGNVGIGTGSPEACALLHVDTREKGFLPPRMDTGQRDNISSPVEGLMIWNYDIKRIEVYDGSNWQRVAYV